MSSGRLDDLTETGGAGEGGGAEGASRGVRLGRRERRRRDARDPRPGQTDPREEATAGPGVQGEGRARAPHAQDRRQGERNQADGCMSQPLRGAFWALIFSLVLIF